MDNFITAFHFESNISQTKKAGQRQLISLMPYIIYRKLKYYVGWLELDFQPGRLNNQL